MIIELDQVDSTNEYAKKLAAHNTDITCVITANHQTQGKGSHGRTWYSKTPEGLYYTLLIKGPTVSFSHLTQLAPLAGEGVIQAISQTYQVKTELKLPNDIILDNKKLGGILIETSAVMPSRVSSPVKLGSASLSRLVRRA